MIDPETRLQQQIRSLRSRNRYVGWFIRRVPVALIAAGSALVIAAYYVFRFYSSPSLTVSVSDSINVLPSEPRFEQLSRENSAGKAQMHTASVADSLVVIDSTSAGDTYVNTSKMP